MSPELEAHIAEMKERILETCSDLDGSHGEVGAAALLAALEIIAEPFRKSASPAERRLIQSHYPDATDETINAYRLDRHGVMNVIEFATTAACKYLDHQPETAGILDGTRSPEDLQRLVPTISRGISNSYAARSSLNASAYDVTAAIITNTVDQAMANDVVPEQIISMLLQNVQKVVERVSTDVDNDI